jgi:hypothetical protein
MVVGYNRGLWESKGEAGGITVVRGRRFLGMELEAPGESAQARVPVPLERCRLGELGMAYAGGS